MSQKLRILLLHGRIFYEDILHRGQFLSRSFAVTHMLISFTAQGSTVLPVLPLWDAATSC